MKAMLTVLSLVLSTWAASALAQDSEITSAGESPSIEAQLQQLQAVNARLKETLSQLRQRYTDLHPEVVSNLRRLEESEQRLAAFEAAHREELSALSAGASQGQSAGPDATGASSGSQAAE